MALPRYDTPEVRLQPGAAATAFQQQAQGWSSLSQQLDQFRNIAYQEAGDQRIREAEVQAQKDQLDGKLLYKESVYTIYGQAYNSARKATYIAETEIDFKNKATIYAEQYKNDPEQFKEAFDTYIKTTKANTKIPEIDLAAELTGKQILDSQYNKLFTAQQEKQKETDRLVFAKYADQKQSELINAIVNNDTKSVSLIRQGLDEYTTSLLEEGVIDDNMFINYYDKFEYGIKKGVLENTVYKLIEEKNIEEAEKVYDEFAKEIPEGFTQEQHKSIKSSLATTINGYKKEQKALKKELSSKADALLQDNIDIMNSGKAPSVLVDRESLKYASESKIEKYNIALEAFNKISEISDLSLAEQEQKVNEYKKDPTANKVDIKVVEQMETNIKRDKALWEKDPITQGIIKLNHEDISIDFSADSEEETLEKLQKRFTQKTRNEVEIGGVAWKILKDSEAIQLAEYLKNPQTPLQDKARILQTVNASGEELADSIYRQVGGKKAYSFSYAGKLTSYGNDSAALISLQGSGSDIKLKEGTKTSIQTKLQGVFRFGTSEDYNTMLNGTVDYIKGKMMQDPSYEINIEKALEETVGKVKKYNGATTILPYGVEEKDFESWLDNIELPNSVIQEDIRDLTDTFGSGDAQLHRVGNGKYRLYYPNDGLGYYQSDFENPNKPLILEYK